MSNKSKSLLAIQPLASEDEPASALFYVLNESSNWEQGEPADGMAFVADPTGILVTAAHVVWLMGKFPGNTVRVFCPSPLIPLRATAKILDRGWRGPQPDIRGGIPRLPGRSDLLDERPDVVLEDIALLQLMPETIEFDASRGGSLDSLELFISRLRVMPLGVPGYRSMESAVFTMWCVDRHFRAPRMVTVNGEFRTHEKALHSAFQIAAPEVTHGFSGSPAWDNDRRLAVGFVRSGTSKRLKGMARCTDARAIHEHAAIPLTWDMDLAKVVSVANGLATDSVGERYAPSPMSSPIFVEPRGRFLRQQLDMGLTDEREDGAPAITFVKETMIGSPMVCLLGGPGAGKSTLLRRFAMEMLDDPTLLRQGPCIPLIFEARDIPLEFDLDVLFSLSRRRGKTQYQERELSNTLVRNDVRVALFIDGLDEIEDRQAAHLLAQCQGLLSGRTSVARVLLSSRPNDRLFKQANNPARSLMLIEVLAFDSIQIEAYVAQCMPEIEERSRFHEALRRVEWNKIALPLQLKMAAQVFRIENALPARDTDLPFEYVRLLVNKGIADATAHEDLSLAPECWIKNYRPNVAKVLQALALLSLEHGQQTLDQLAKGLGSLSCAEPFAKVLQSPKECIDYIRRDLIPKVGLITIQRRHDGERLAWEHATFVDVLAAEARLSMAGNDPIAVSRLVERDKPFGGDRFMLTQLSAMDRAGWHDQVVQRVKRAMEAPFSDRKEGMFALRALAAGVELSSDLRQRLVYLLIRIALSPKHDFQFCHEVFSDGEALPSARDILQRQSMREDVISALWMRFRLRDPRRRGQKPPLIVTHAEAALLDLLDMWNEWLHVGLELVHPDSLSRAGGSVKSESRGTLEKNSIERGGFEIMHKDGTVSTFEMPAREFLEGVVATAKTLPPNLPPAQVVSIYLKVVTQVLNGKQG